MTGFDPSELRELAERALDLDNTNDGVVNHDEALALARGLLSALDALQKRDQDLEAAIKVIWKWHRKKQAAEASRDQAIKERDEWKRQAVENDGAFHAKCDDLLRAEASRDQAIKERDEANRRGWAWNHSRDEWKALAEKVAAERDRWKQEAREWADASLENRDEADRLAEALRQIVAHLTTADGLNIPRGEAPKLHARNIADAALAGVLGGPTEYEFDGDGRAYARYANGEVLPTGYTCRAFAGKSHVTPKRYAEIAGVPGGSPEEPEHLRDDAPYRVCDTCGRKSWALADRCGMSQPDGSRCPGVFRWPEEHPQEHNQGGQVNDS